jgi:tetratricopeptide (TPR) repeat protein
MERVRIVTLAIALAALASCAPMRQGAAQSALAEGRLDDAAADIQSALASDPDNLELKHLAAQIFTQRGVKYYQNNEMLAAADDFHRAADYDPFYASAWDYLGLIAFSQHDWQNAISYGQKAAGLSGKPDPSYVQQAQQELLKVRAGGIKPYVVPHQHRTAGSDSGASAAPPPGN